MIVPAITEAGINGNEEVGIALPAIAADQFAAEKDDAGTDQKADKPAGRGLFRNSPRVDNNATAGWRHGNRADENAMS